MMWPVLFIQPLGQTIKPGNNPLDITESSVQSVNGSNPYEGSSIPPMDKLGPLDFAVKLAAFHILGSRFETRQTRVMQCTLQDVVSSVPAKWPLRIPVRQDHLCFIVNQNIRTV
jgi:hypothetical protein